MSDVSINGWTVIDKQGDSRLARYAIPGSNRSVILNKLAASILIRVASVFDRHIADLDPDPLAVWGWNYRRIRPQQDNPNAPFSDHASGTAIDLRSDKFPIGKRNMTTRQRLWVRRILRNCNGLIIWGGDYKQLPDEMHFAIAPGVTPERITAWRIKHRIDAAGNLIKP